MLTMKIVHEKEELEQICSMAGICPEGSCCYVAREGKKLVGYCLYRPEEYGLHIMSVECFGDISLFDGLIRATAATLFDRPEDRVTFGERVDPVSYTHLDVYKRQRLVLLQQIMMWQQCC